MAALTGLTIVKRMTYRASTIEEYSNTYHFTGDVPADAAAWRTLFDAVVAVEKGLYPGSTVSVVRGYGYADDAINAHAVWSVDLTVSPNAPVAGTLATGGGTLAPGDCAVWMRWKTDRLNSKGKPVYLRKYFHPALSPSVGPADNVLTGQKTALQAVATFLSDGELSGGRKIRSRTHNDNVIATAVSTYVTTRTLKRRGKRPS